MSMLCLAGLLSIMVTAGDSAVDDAYGGDYSDDFISNFRSCGSKDTPPRGTYFAVSLPCDFRFYQAAVDTEEDEPPRDDRLSDSCSAGQSKLIMEKEDYALLWPDECVGSFSRCYNLSPRVYQNDRRSNLTAALMLMNWSIPTEVTHLSVNCTADRQATEDVVLDITVGLQQGLDEIVFVAKVFVYVILFGILACVFWCCIMPLLNRQREPRHLHQTRAYEMVAPATVVRVVPAYSAVKV